MRYGYFPAELGCRIQSNCKSKAEPDGLVSLQDRVSELMNYSRLQIVCLIYFFHNCFFRCFRSAILAKLESLTKMGPTIWGQVLQSDISPSLALSS